MKRFIEGDNRQQITLLPESLDEYIDAENPVRIVDMFVDQLDLGGLGFSVEPAATGRPSYHSSTLLKLYVYGYLTCPCLQSETGHKDHRHCRPEGGHAGLTGPFYPLYSECQPATRKISGRNF